MSAARGSSARRQMRIELDGFITTDQRGVELLAPEKQRPAIRIGFGELRNYLDGLFIVRHCRVRLVRLLAYYTAVVVSLGKLGIEFDGLVIICEGCIQLHLS